MEAVHTAIAAWPAKQAALEAAAAAAADDEGDGGPGGGDDVILFPGRGDADVTAPGTEGPEGSGTPRSTLRWLAHFGMEARLLGQLMRLRSRVGEAAGQGMLAGEQLWAAEGYACYAAGRICHCRLSGSVCLEGREFNGSHSSWCCSSGVLEGDKPSPDCPPLLPSRLAWRRLHVARGAGGPAANQHAVQRCCLQRCTGSIAAPPAGEKALPDLTSSA